MSATESPVPQDTLENILAMAREWAESCDESSPRVRVVQSTDYRVLTKLRANPEYARNLAGHAKFHETVYFTVLEGDFAVPLGSSGEHRSAQWVGLFIKDGPLRVRSFITGDQPPDISLADLGSVYSLA